MSIDEFLQSKEDSKIVDERIKKQQEFLKKYEEQKKNQEEEAKRKEAELAKKREERLKTFNSELAQSVGDNAVSKDRYALEKKELEQWIKNDLGGTIDLANIQSGSIQYEYNQNGSKLIYKLKPEYAESIGFPSGFTTQEFTRSDLIGLGAIPQRFGPGYTPIYMAGTSRSPLQNSGNVATNQINSNATERSSVQALFGYNKSTSKTNRTYKRNISQKSFIGAKKVLPQNQARLIAHRARNKGLLARTIKAKQGYRVYLGPKRAR